MLSPEALAAAKRCAMSAPPVTPEQKALLRRILGASNPGFEPVRKAS